MQQLAKLGIKFDSVTPKPKDKDTKEASDTAFEKKPVLKNPGVESKQDDQTFTIKLKQPKIELEATYGSDGQVKMVSIPKFENTSKTGLTHKDKSALTAAAKLFPKDKCPTMPTIKEMSSAVARDIAKCFEDAGYDKNDIAKAFNHVTIKDEHGKTSNMQKLLGIEARSKRTPPARAPGDRDDGIALTTASGPEATRRPAPTPGGGEGKE